MIEAIYARQESQVLRKPYITKLTTVQQPKPLEKSG